jgi:hypothetical protein
MRVGVRTAQISSDFRNHDPGPGIATPSEGEIRQAIASIPDSPDWSWARPRLAPVFQRPASGGVTGDPLLLSVSEMGVAFGFAIEVGPLFMPVTTSLAERWEASLQQIEAAAFDHLHAVVASIRPNVVQRAVHHGHLIRALPEPGGWASSVILAGVDEVTRIFGSHDQILAAPSRNILLSFSASTPSDTVVDVTLGIEEMDLHPLNLDPFVLEDGRLSWTGILDDADLVAT